MSRTLPPACRQPVRFLLSVEISTIYKKGERTRKVHHLLFAPSFHAAERITAALAKIGNPEAGPALEDRFRTELSSEVRSMLAAALGAVGRTQAISLLIESLNDPWEVLRGCAAWSLGHLKALEAEDALTQAVKREQNAYSKTQLERALSEMRSERRRQARAEVSRKTTRGSVRRRAR